MSEIILTIRLKLTDADDSEAQRREIADLPSENISENFHQKVNMIK